MAASVARGRLAAGLLLCLASACATIPSPPVRGFLDGQNWVLTEDLVYRVGATREIIRVPAGFVTDYASIPQPLHAILRQHSRYSRAALVHDYLYWTQSCSRRQSDNLLMIAMRETGVGFGSRWAVYGGVLAGGEFAWAANRRARQAGIAKVIPRNRFEATNEMTWPAVRDQLQHSGYREPSYPVNPSFCRLGNSNHVP